MLHASQNNSAGIAQTVAESQRENLLKRFAHIFARNPEFLLEVAKPDLDPTLAMKLAAAEVKFNKERRRALKGEHTGSDTRRIRNQMKTGLEQVEVPQVEAIPQASKKKGKGKTSKSSYVPMSVPPSAFNGDTSLSIVQSQATTPAQKSGSTSLAKGQHLSLGIKHSKDGKVHNTGVVDAEGNERRFEARLGQIMKVYETRVATLEKKHAKHLKTVEERLESSETIQSQLMKLNEKLAATSEHNLKLAALVLKRLPDQQLLTQSHSDNMLITAMKQDESSNDAGGSIAAAALAQARAMS